jgi:hypothetical protein
MIALRRFAIALAALAASALATPAICAEGSPAGTLLARYAELRDRLADTPFKRPLYLESRQAPGAVHGDVYALIEHALPDVKRAVRGPSQWCDILILHINVKDCRANGARQGVLVARVGRKHDTADEAAHAVEFAFAVADDEPDYVEVTLRADAGPLGTKNYRITLEATDVDPGRTFLHLAYSYAYGAAAALAMRTYMATAGARKVGFTVVGRASDGTPELVRDQRGAVERNAMRYFLAIDACLSTLSEPREARAEQRFEKWFDSTEHYSRQLHEIERSEYLSMKLNGTYAGLNSSRR